jgi:two-component system chemotaxis response regulator CheY
LAFGGFVVPQATPGAEESRQQAVLARRFQALGLEAKPMPGGRCVVVDLPLGPEPLETLGEPRSLRAVRFVTVGLDRIKCLAPHPLFYLPLIRISDCCSCAALEARIRGAWKQRLDLLHRTRDWLEKLGVQCESPRSTPQWVFRLGLDEHEARAAAIEPRRVILPSTGPLSGVPLERAEDRVFHPDPGCAEAVDLDIAVTSRLEELARCAERVREQRRRHRDDDAPRSLEVLKRGPPVVLVGPTLYSDRALHDSLYLRGFDVATARSIDEAVMRFEERSFELVLTDARLDRADGIELIPTLRAVAGIEEVPVVLVDDRRREARRLTARGAGASGYVARPLDVSRLSVGLARLIEAPPRRRFTRYPRALSVSWPGCQAEGVTQNIGRGGMRLQAWGGLPPDEAARYQIHLPEMGTVLQVDAEVVARPGEPGRPGASMHFRSFSSGSERTWIEFLRNLEPRTREPDRGAQRS